MSAVRVYVDGRPVWVKADDGYAPHRPANRIGGELVTGDRAIPRILPATTPERRAQMAAYRAKKPLPVEQPAGRPWPDTPRCGVVMKILGEPCYRLPGHADSHRSRAVMEHDSQRRRRAA